MLCSWGRCKSERIQPEVTNTHDRYRLPREGRFCQKHTDQIVAIQTKRVEGRRRRQQVFRQEWIAQRMPAYEAELKRWEHLRAILEWADSDNPPLHEQYLQAVATLETYKPKKPE